jgi:hypothetical protein
MSSDVHDSLETEEPQELQAASQHPVSNPSMSQHPKAPLPNTNSLTSDDIEFVSREVLASGAKMNEEETAEQRIERLGRERPQQFKTLWAEIGFVFSITMSQVLTVRSYFHDLHVICFYLFLLLCQPNAILEWSSGIFFSKRQHLTCAGILCLWFLGVIANPCRRLKHSRSFKDMACERLLTCGRVISTGLRPPC